MRFFIAVAVAALGIGCYAAAALTYDRRRQVGAWLQRRRAAPSAAGRGTVAVEAAPPGVLYAVILGLLAFGTMLLVGSCFGLIVF